MKKKKKKKQYIIMKEQIRHRVTLILEEKNDVHVVRQIDYNMFLSARFVM